MKARQGPLLPKLVSIGLGIVTSLVVIAAPQAESRPFGCNAARPIAADGAPLHCPLRAAANCKPFLA